MAIAHLTLMHIQWLLVAQVCCECQIDDSDITLMVACNFVIEVIRKGIWTLPTINLTEVVHTHQSPRIYTHANIFQSSRLSSEDEIRGNMSFP